MRSSVKRKIQPRDDIMQQSFSEVILQMIFYSEQFLVYLLNKNIYDRFRLIIKFPVDIFKHLLIEIEIQTYRILLVDKP